VGLLRLNLGVVEIDGLVKVFKSVFDLFYTLVKVSFNLLHLRTFQFGLKLSFQVVVLLLALIKILAYRAQVLRNHQADILLRVETILS
jgi:hypothetical protein